MMSPMEQYIRSYAASIGLNPDIVMRVVMSEGGPQSLQPAGYARQSRIGEGTSNHEELFGPLQMNINGGLGARALAAGIGDPRNPADAFKIVKYGLDVMKAEGLSHWHGWHGDQWAARMGGGTGEDVPMPLVAGGSYDARRDTPSYARPTGADVAKYADEHPVGAEGDVVTSSSPYSLPGTADNPLITQEKPANPFEKFASSVGKLGNRPKGGVDIAQIPNPPTTTLPTQGTIDPAAAQRQALMMQIAMQRLNSGQLWPMSGGGQFG